MANKRIKPPSDDNADNATNLKGSNKKKGPIPSSRYYKAPMLSAANVTDMLNKIKGFEYQVEIMEHKKVCSIPYCLPFDWTLLTCYCSKVFRQKCGTPTYRHLAICTGVESNAVSSPIPKIVYNSTEYDQLRGAATFFVLGDNLHLRMHQEIIAFVCVCGHTNSFGRMQEHMETCAYLQQFFKSDVGYDVVSTTQQATQILNYRCMNKKTARFKQLVWVSCHQTDKLLNMQKIEAGTQVKDHI